MPSAPGRWIEVAPPGGPDHRARPARVPAGVRLATGTPDSDHADLRARGVDADPEVLRMAEPPPMFSSMTRTATR